MVLLVLTVPAKKSTPRACTPKARVLEKAEPLANGSRAGRPDAVKTRAASSVISQLYSQAPNPKKLRDA